jgi:NAD(P)-dependent dehydrogenase (short-subunit alcohol dehydrogenase family)
MRLTGKVVLVTNVAQYMGPACVEEFAKEGAVLALHERTEARAQAALELARAYGREASVVTGDLGVSGEANRVVRAVADRHGRLDVLVNNSSHLPVGGPVDEISDETWRSMAAHLNVGSESALSCPHHTAWCSPRRRVITMGGRVINRRRTRGQALTLIFGPGPSLDFPDASFSEVKVKA